jgi:hypothetical protein
MLWRVSEIKVQLCNVLNVLTLVSNFVKISGFRSGKRTKARSSLKAVLSLPLFENGMQSEYSCLGAVGYMRLLSFHTRCGKLTSFFELSGNMKKGS